MRASSPTFYGSHLLEKTPDAAGAREKQKLARQE
jgi:hypothetical protein